MSAHKYELLFIADPELDERGLKKLTEQYLEIVTNEGGFRREHRHLWAVASSPMRSPARPRATTWWSTTPASPATNDELDRGAQPQRIRDPYEDPS